MIGPKQLVDRDAPREASIDGGGPGHDHHGVELERPARSAEGAARDSLRRQIERLEREISGIFTEAFPHLPTTIYGRQHEHGPRLLDLGELERLRDRLAARAQDAREMLTERVQFEQQSRELLQQMKLYPGHYRHTRISVRDLGQGTCGVWEVRPRLGLIGMLAGWWQVKLSSGCPLSSGCAHETQPDRI